MNLVQMSFYGAVLAFVVMIVRVLAMNRLPKRTFIVLWSVVLIRLLLPFEITSAYSVSTLGNSQPLKTLRFQSTPFFLHLHISVELFRFSIFLLLFTVQCHLVNSREVDPAFDMGSYHFYD